MSSSTSQSWYLLKHDDGSIFGPASFDQLNRWAKEAQVSPLDKVSVDQTNWMRAPMLPELEMDWLVEVTADHCYGPTTLSTVQEFLGRGEIGLETILINARDGSSRTVEEMPELTIPPDEEEPGEGQEPQTSEGAVIAGGEPAEEPQPGRTPSIRFSLQQRVRELENSLTEERQMMASLNERYAELEAKYIKLLGHPLMGNARGEE